MKWIRFDREKPKSDGKFYLVANDAAFLRYSYIAQWSNECWWTITGKVYPSFWAGPLKEPKV